MWIMELLLIGIDIFMEYVDRKREKANKSKEARRRYRRNKKR